MLVTLFVSNFVDIYVIEFQKRGLPMLISSWPLLLMTNPLALRISMHSFAPSFLIKMKTHLHMKPLPSTWSMAHVGYSILISPVWMDLRVHSTTQRPLLTTQLLKKMGLLDIDVEMMAEGLLLMATRSIIGGLFHITMFCVWSKRTSMLSVVHKRGLSNTFLSICIKVPIKLHLSLRKMAT